VLLVRRDDALVARLRRCNVRVFERQRLRKPAIDICLRRLPLARLDDPDAAIAG
jgi:hypothetical protein